MSRKENRFVSALSGLGIFLVVVGHAQAGPAAHAGLGPGHDFYAGFSTVVRFIYTFHMPLFFLISGYLVMYATLRGGARGYPPYGRFLSGKARRLLAPYAVISTVTFPLKVVLSENASRPVGFSAGDYLETLFLPWHNTIIFFWFLPTLFLMFALSPLLLRPERPWRADAALIACGIALWFVFPNRHDSGPLAWLNAGGLLHNLVFFMLGFMLRKYGLDRVLWALHPAWMLTGVAGLLVFIPCRDVIWVRFGLSLLGLVFAMAAARALEGVFAGVGDVSFDIYLFSWFPQAAVRILLGQWIVVHAAVLVVCSITGGLLVPILGGALREHILPDRWRFLLGGSDPPSRPSTPGPAWTQQSPRT